MNLYKLFNVTKSIWEFVISDQVPQELPINPDDELRMGSLTLVEEDIFQNNYGYKVIASLDNYKSLRYHEIDSKTGEIIAQGYSFSGKKFSLSINAQINITALNSSRDMLTYPIEYNTIDDSDTFFINDATEMNQMYMTALATKKGVVDSGTLLKDQIRSCSNESEVDSIIDNR